MPIKDRPSLVESDSEILPGIEFLEAPGHSPDHSVLVISSGNEQLLYSADIFHHPIQIARPGLCTVVDLMPEEATKMRTKIIRRVMVANMMVFACHFPFPRVGHIVLKGNTFFGNR
jgi:glyoxylase-like metal-dependent hydrolase (beta-lactamase superfamily II)